MSSLQVASAAFIFVHHMLSRRRKRRERRWWQTELYRERSVYSGTSLLADLKFQEVSGQYKHFTRMTAADFELLINLVGPKIVKMDTRFRAAVPVQERQAVTQRFLSCSARQNAQVCTRPKTTQANPSGRWNYGREISENFAESGDFHVTFGLFYMS